MSKSLGYACGAIVLSLVSTTTVMSVQDRIKEHAVLQTLGFTGRTVFALVLSESIVLSLIGGALGIALAVITLELSSLSVSAEAVSVAFLPSLRLIGVSLAVALATGLAAGIWPAWQAARVDILTALRAS